jgi:DNA primase
MIKAMISDYTIKAVKELPITSILEKEQIPFKRVGREAITVCPWHNDKNPSLTISDEKGFCYCFVCQSGKDGIGFVEQKLGLGFADAVERIARLHAIEVCYENIDPELAAKEVIRRNQFNDQLKRQHLEFRGAIRHVRAQRIRDFLDCRKILPATSKYFELGYAVSGFFADRITVPIHDHLGNLIGFTGRATKNEVKPKYKNTESNEYFDKSKIVFNEHRAFDYIKEADSIIFVEGHFDVISLWQYGIRNVVAMQGTAAPSMAILHRLSRRTKRFILCYDADEGGNKAIEQFVKVAGPMACKGEISISIARLPAGTDPDQCIRENIIDMFAAIENSSPWLDWQLEVWLASVDRSNTALFTNIECRIKELIDSIASPVLRQHYIDKASKLLALDSTGASRIAKEWNQNASKSGYKRTWVKPTPAQTRITVERRLLRMYIHFKEQRENCKVFMDELESPSHRWLWQRIQEIERHGNDVELKCALVAVLLVAEPYYIRQLRSLTNPTIKLSYTQGIMSHIANVLSQKLVTNS